MSRIKVETRDPWAYIRDDARAFVNVLPKTRATITVPTTVGIRVGWSLFWRSLWWTIRRRGSVEFWMEGES